jgi:hypothetical protein
MLHCCGYRQGLMATPALRCRSDDLGLALPLAG